MWGIGRLNAQVWWDLKGLGWNTWDTIEQSETDTSWEILMEEILHQIFSLSFYSEGLHISGARCFPSTVWCIADLPVLDLGSSWLRVAESGAGLHSSLLCDTSEYIFIFQKSCAEHGLNRCFNEQVEHRADCVVIGSLHVGYNSLYLWSSWTHGSLFWRSAEHLLSALLLVEFDRKQLLPLELTKL